MNRPTPTRTRTLALATVATGISALAAQSQAVVFFDGVFNNSDWTLTTITNAGGAGSFANGFQMPVGGNPNQYRIIRNSLSINGANSLLVGVHMNNFAFYNPGSGAITQINYSEDSKNFVNQGGNGQGSGCVIVQGGRTYLQRNPILVMPFSSFSNWGANPAPGLVASDFWEIDIAGNLFAGNNPDFSISGGVMQFGFYRGNSSGTLSSGVFNSECGIDNWRVDVVPSPSGAAALAGAGLLAMRRRRR
jgi:hypothetical protein